MATLPTTQGGWGIRLPRNEFRGKRTNPDQIGFGKRPMQETAPTAESYPIKMSQKEVIARLRNNKHITTKHHIW